MTVGFRFSVKGPITPDRNSSYRVRVISRRVDERSAHGILCEMNRIITELGHVSITTLREICDQETPLSELNEHEYHWGWTFLGTAAILETTEGMFLNLPPAVLIERGMEA